jgi:hypothetical protein
VKLDQLLLLLIIGVAAAVYGGRLAFDVRGAATRTYQRRLDALQANASARGQLAAADPLPAWFFRMVGWVAFGAGVLMLLLALIVSLA